MNAVYIRSRDPDKDCFVGSVIAEMPASRWLSGWQSVWTRQDGHPRRARLRSNRTSTLSAGIDGCDDERQMRCELFAALCASDFLEVETEVTNELPFWLADVPEHNVARQEIAVKMYVGVLLDSPDVKAYIAEMEHVALLLAGNTFGVASVHDPSVALARRMASQLHVQEGAVIACESGLSKVVLTLGRPLDEGVFAARADVCGSGLLTVSAGLSRTLVDVVGSRWSTALGEVTDLL